MSMIISTNMMHVAFSMLDSQIDPYVKDVFGEVGWSGGSRKHRPMHTVTKRVSDHKWNVHS